MTYVNNYDERGRFIKLTSREGPPGQVDNTIFSYLFRREKIAKEYFYEDIGLETQEFLEQFNLDNIERILKEDGLTNI